MAQHVRVAVSAIVVASVTLIASLKREEGIRYEPYYDTVGVKTVCVGSTNNVENRRYSEAECEALLRREVREYGTAALACIAVPISQSEYEAYASLAFNIGTGAFCKSTLVKKLRAGDYLGACKEILRWSAKQPELAPRRQREYQKCITPATQLIEVPNVVESVIAVPEDRGSWLGNRIRERFNGSDSGS
jgi:lysozyme